MKNTGLLTTVIFQILTIFSDIFKSLGLDIFHVYFISVHFNRPYVSNAQNDLIITLGYGVRRLFE
jgi:hypothetical protein